MTSKLFDLDIALPLDVYHVINKITSQEIPNIVKIMLTLNSGVNIMISVARNSGYGIYDYYIFRRMFQTEFRLSKGLQLCCRKG